MTEQEYRERLVDRVWAVIGSHPNTYGTQLAELIVEEIVPPSHKVLPREPTGEMHVAGAPYTFQQDIWVAMHDKYEGPADSLPEPEHKETAYTHGRTAGTKNGY